MILGAILDQKRREVARRGVRRSRATLEIQIARSFTPVRPFDRALRDRRGVSVIAEIKRKSPSGGALRPGASAMELARRYAAHGAAALSVLTDFQYFGGQGRDLTVARGAACGLPILCKDFIVDEYQVLEARALGADAVLLIVRVLGQAELAHMLDVVHAWGMQALVETHSADEVRAALDAGARIIGVNNRDLDTLDTDPLLAPRLRPLVPPECVFVAESGVGQPQQMADLADAGVDAVLIGEALVRALDPGERLRQLVTAGLAVHGQYL